MINENEQCLGCLRKGGVSVVSTNTSFPYGCDNVEVPFTLNVHTCSYCDEQWTKGEDSEVAKSEALILYLTFELRETKFRLEAAQRLLASDATKFAGCPALASTLVPDIRVNCEKVNTHDLPDGHYLQVGEMGPLLKTITRNGASGEEPAIFLRSPLPWELDQEDQDLALNLKDGRYTLAIVVLEAIPQE